jgi:hypothetical protein
MREKQRASPGLEDGRLLPEVWKMIISRSPEVHWTVLDGEAVLLNLENGVYYTLNDVGTKICQPSAARGGQQSAISSKKQALRSCNAGRLAS